MYEKFYYELYYNNLAGEEIPDMIDERYILFGKFDENVYVFESENKLPDIIKHIRDDRNLGTSYNGIYYRHKNNSKVYSLMFKFETAEELIEKYVEEFI